MVKGSTVWHLVTSQAFVNAISRKWITQQALCINTVFTSFTMEFCARFLCCERMGNDNHVYFLKIWLCWLFYECIHWISIQWHAEITTYRTIRASTRNIYPAGQFNRRPRNSESSVLVFVSWSWFVSAKEKCKDVEICTTFQVRIVSLNRHCMSYSFSH